MKYVIKQKIVALKPEYAITDAAGKLVYKVNGSFLGRESFSISDMEGNELAKCGTDANALNFLASVLRYNLKKYHIRTNGESLISMARSINIFTFKMNVESKIGDIQFGYGAKGSFQLTLGDTILCDIEKKNLTLGGDEYHVEVDDMQDRSCWNC